jgi:hypothetical protein
MQNEAILFMGRALLLIADQTPRMYSMIYQGLNGGSGAGGLGVSTSLG